MEEDYSKFLKLINNCNDQDPLLSTTKLGERLDKISLNCVNPTELNQLNQALNVEQLITTENGLARDYRGLAELMGFSSIEIKTRFGKHNPTKSIIDSFIKRNLDSKGNCNISINDLIKLIEKLERFDVIDDLLPFLVNIASNGNNNYQPQVLIRNDQRISNSNKAQNLVSEVDRLTIDDTSQVTTLYDAFICYAPNDIEYAHELISLLEEYNAKIAVADDLLPGHFEHDALIRLIEMRCKKVIIILTPNFSKSKECEFQTKFAGESAIRDGSPKIIPVLYESCEDSMLPSMIKVMSKIDMTDRRSQHWQMKRLINSLGLNFDRSNNINRALHYNNHDNHRQSIALTQESYNDNNINSNDKPKAFAINLSQTNTNDSAITSSGPIIDLLQSQNSDSIMTNNMQSTCSINDNIELSIQSLKERKSPSGSGGGVSGKLSQTLRGMVNKVFGNSPTIMANTTISPSTSSQLMLLSPSSTNFPSTDSVESININNSK